MGQLAVVAIGGNSLIKDKEHQRVEDQYKAVCETARHIADLVALGFDVVVTHGNGPQVGFIMRRSEIAYKKEGLHMLSLVACGADTQGAIGYQIQQALDNEFSRRELAKQAVTVVTQVEVDAADPAFQKPTKPIGSFYTEEEARQHQQENPEWVMAGDAGRGYRRVVPSPAPQRIIELEAIKKLLEQGFTVIAAGGGGIPVVRNAAGNLEGIDAVIDKDYASSLLAGELGADLLIISTGVPKVCLNFGRENQQELDRVSLAQAREYAASGHFAGGSMLPKVQAVINFLEKGGCEALITSPENLGRAVRGESGTRFTL